MPERNNFALISSALRAMRDETAYTAYAELALKELERVSEALLSAEAEVERLRDLIDTVIRNCMECYDKRECQSCAWLREGTEAKP